MVGNRGDWRSQPTAIAKTTNIVLTDERETQFQVLTTKIVVSDVAGWNTEFVQHLEDSRISSSGTAQIVFDILGGRMMFEIVFEYHLVDKTDVPVQLSSGFRFGKGNMELEIGKSFSIWRN